MLQKEFEDFYSDIRIDSETEKLIEKRNVLKQDIKSKLPNIMNGHDIKLNKSDIKMIDQGSYKYNTTIKSDVVDRDVAVIIPLNISDNKDPRIIKTYLKESIDIQQRTVEIKEPCVRAVYKEQGEEWLHIDLPLYAKYNDNLYLARGKASSKNYSWEDADPEGLNQYLCDSINGNSQLRRIICYLKQWKQIKYENASSSHEVPPSIGLTLLAIECFSHQTIDDRDDDLSTLQSTVKKMLDKFSSKIDFEGNRVYTIQVTLPVKPYSNVFFKMNDNHMNTFYERLDKVNKNLVNAINCADEHDAAKYVQNVLGADFVVPPKRGVTVISSTAREKNFG